MPLRFESIILQSFSTGGVLLSWFSPFFWQIFWFIAGMLMPSISMLMVMSQSSSVPWPNAAVAPRTHIVIIAQVAGLSLMR